MQINLTSFNLSMSKPQSETSFNFLVYSLMIKIVNIFSSTPGTIAKMPFSIKLNLTKLTYLKNKEFETVLPSVKHRGNNINARH